MTAYRTLQLIKECAESARKPRFYETLGTQVGRYQLALDTILAHCADYEQMIGKADPVDPADSWNELYSKAKKMEGGR